MGRPSARNRQDISGPDSASVKMSLIGRVRNRLISAVALYLARPVRHNGASAIVDPQSLSSILRPGDVLLTDGNTRAAALVRLITKSSWAHVAMYVGPLEEGPDPRCIVEADVIFGVRSVPLSELKGLGVRVLRTGLRVAASRPAQALVNRWFTPPADEIVLPDYSAIRKSA